MVAFKNAQLSSLAALPSDLGLIQCALSPTRGAQDIGALGARQISLDCGRRPIANGCFDFGVDCYDVSCVFLSRTSYQTRGECLARLM